MPMNSMPFCAFLPNVFNDARLAAHFSRRASRLVFLASSLLVFSMSMASGDEVQVDTGFSLCSLTAFDLLTRDASFCSF